MRVLRIRQQLNRSLVCGLMFVALPFAAHSAEVRVAVASNFAPALRALATQFEADSGHRVSIAVGSTGQHYAQIINGAPLDVFFAADERRPLALEANGHALADTGFVYAQGALVLWSPRPGLLGTGPEILRAGEFRFLAIANPRLAPYGRAAQETLTSLGLWETLEPRLVRGANIAQTLQFVRSGNAEIGFIAAAQLPLLDGSGSHWQVPQELHQPLRQRAAVLRATPATQAFIAFVQSPAGGQLIRAFGYTLPSD